MKGHTKSCNFFELGSSTNERLILVDMPGYGKNSKQEWGDMVLKYLENRRQLRRVFLLRDLSKRFSPLDDHVALILDRLGISFQLVLTKTDLFPRELQKFQQKIIDDVTENSSKRWNNTQCLVMPVLTSSTHDVIVDHNKDSPSSSIDRLRVEILAAAGILKM